MRGSDECPHIGGPERTPVRDDEAGPIVRTWYHTHLLQRRPSPPPGQGRRGRGVRVLERAEVRYGVGNGPIVGMLGTAPPNTETKNAAAAKIKMHPSTATIAAGSSTAATDLPVER